MTYHRRLSLQRGKDKKSNAIPLHVSPMNYSAGFTYIRHLPPPPPLCDIPSGCWFFTGPWTVTRSSLRAAPGRCVLSAAAACVPCGVVFALAEPSSWRTGAVLVAAGVVSRPLLPTPLLLVVHHPPRCVSVGMRSVGLLFLHGAVTRSPPPPYTCVASSCRLCFAVPHVAHNRARVLFTSVTERPICQYGTLTFRCWRRKFSSMGTGALSTGQRDGNAVGQAHNNPACRARRGDATCA